MKKITCFGSLILALGLIFGQSAQALTLGRLSVLSFLGQPLVAEIEVPEISPEESNSLRVRIANAEAFKSAGLDYSAAVAELTVTGKRRADGRAILEVRGNQPVTAPFVDLVLEITWNAGRMLRDYTVLLDPPATPNQALVMPSPTLPMLSASSTALSVAASPAVTTPVAEFTVKTQNEESELRAKRAAPIKAKPSAKEKLKTKKGDTAAAIAAANKPEGVSLDQMLVAMLRSNPQAFVDGNVNRLKAGVIMDMPTAEDAAATKAQEAKNSIKAQARDFNEYRRKLASNATANLDKESSRNASGKVVAKVQDKQSATPADDRLTLAKPAQAAKANALEDKIAKDRAAADVAARSSELNKNINELSKLAGASAPAVAAPPSAATSAPSVAAPVTLPASAPQPTVSAPLPPVRQPVPPQPDPSLLDQALMHPLALPAAGVAGLVLLLSALFAVRRRRRTQAFKATQDSTISFSPTRQPPTDTIFGPMGASEVDTQETQSHASTTMVYAPSQLSTVTGDVDPIAEADVYLAYNRDVQAEEILKEAKRNAPKRTDIQVKLLEIYAKRQDMEAFDAGAQELHLLTDGVGDDWSKTRMLARDIGSMHSLFKVTGSAFAETAPASQTAYNNNSLSFVPQPTTVNLSTSGPSVIPEPHSGTGLIDFDLSSLTLDLPTHPAEFVPAAMNPAQEDPKLALAEEYLSIGDKAGARALIDEVLQQSTDPQVVTQAHQMLARLG